MSKTTKTLFIKIAAGIVLGLLVGIGFMLIGQETRDSFMGVSGSAGTILYLIYCGVIGAAGMAGTMLYDIERYSLTRATATHLLIVLTGLLLLGVFLGWKPNEIQVWIIIGADVAVFFLIWIIMYLSYKRRIRRMNEELKKWKSAKNPRP